MKGLEAEVYYAVNILRHAARHGRSFSIEDVRELVNAKLDLCLTAEHDHEFKASLWKHDEVTPVAQGGERWAFRQSGC